MDEIVKHINDTNASYRALGAGDAKNTDLFLDNEHFRLFESAGEQITVRYNKVNLTKAILFIASILPRKYDNSSVHTNVSFSTQFVFKQLEMLDGYFMVDGKAVDTKTQIWNARKDVLKKNGKVDNRFYFNGLIDEYTYTNSEGIRIDAKFTIRNYLAGGYSDIHIKRADDGIFDVWVTNASVPYNDEESGLRLGKASQPQLTHPINLSTDKYNRYISAMMTKPFVLLAGISGTGKSQIVRKLARATDDIDFFANEQQRWEKHTPENFEIVQVKPNWHNSLDLLGYKSNIGERPHYVTTTFIRFMVKAMLHPNTPFLLCLDEMNLAPVEEYFAEYLSAIESRSIENGQYKTDTLIKPFKQFDEDYMTEEECVSTMMLEDLMKDLDDPHNLKEKVSEELLNKGLMIPQNLIVFGTVNMDETTFSFSRKVLDRAMSIEMNVVQFGSFVGGQMEEMPPVLTDLNGQLVYRQMKAQQCMEGNAPKDYKALTKTEAQQVVNYLEEVNRVLEGTPFKLGYRACNEALLYARANKEIVADGTEFMKKALDEFTMMKILSRIEGDTSKLHFEYNKDGHDVKYNKAETLLDALEIVIKDHVELGQSDTLTKLESMKKILERDHFVSFWG